MLVPREVCIPCICAGVVACISDVSALGGVHSLNLSNCFGISDVSALGGVYSLELNRY
jgi:hypothetical protein